LLARAVLLRLADSPGIQRFVRRRGMSAGFARRFVAGETLEETAAAVRALNERGITATVDYLGENVTSRQEAAESAACYCRILDFLDAQRLDSNVSLKLTQLGLDLSDDLACENLRTILERAEQYGNFVRIDMEGSRYTQRTLDLFYRLWPDHKNVGVVIQAYLYRSAADVERLIADSVRVRLCKGAYSEPREVAFQSKRDVDQNFVRLARELLSRGRWPALATHDERMIQAAIAHARAEAIDASRFEFQMLYGIRRERQQGLVREGWRMRVYVPFGTQWYAYMMRRLAERPANLWFVLKNLLRR